MSKLPVWSYPQGVVCVACPRDHICFINFYGVRNPLKVRNCKYFKPNPLLETIKHGGIQLLLPENETHNAKVKAASGLCGKPILDIRGVTPNNIRKFLPLINTKIISIVLTPVTIYQQGIPLGWWPDFIKPVVVVCSPKIGPRIMRKSG